LTVNDASKGFFIALGLALVVALGLAVWLLGRDRLMTLGLIFVIGLTLALVMGASALPIRAYRRRDQTGETHYVHDGTKTIVRETRILDGRQVTAPEVKLLQLPQQANGGAYPELLRAAFAAGTMRLPAQRQEAAAVPDQDLAELDLSGDLDGWGGEIRP
jgi:hypothetical protein